MKVTVKENETFKPITIELVIESEQELIDLYANINVGLLDVKRNNPKYFVKDNAMELFRAVDECMKHLNLKK